SDGPASGRQGGGRERTPFAGPGAGAPFEAQRGAPRFGGIGAMTFAGRDWDVVDPGLVAFLQANQGGARFLVATPTSGYASVFELLSDQPAMALGCYQGWDRIL